MGNKESKIYSYILRYDDGAAPNPFWGTCTLAICKPAIRRTAQIGDWVIGTGSVNAECNDGMTHNLSQCLVYAMKITNIMSLGEYDEYCRNRLPDKIPDPNSSNWIARMGDCIYFDSGAEQLDIREGCIHQIQHRDRDVGGMNVLLSKHFYYFGESAVVIPEHLTPLIKNRSQGHLKIENSVLVRQFEKWIKSFQKNKLYGEPQLKHRFDKADCTLESYCSPDYMALDKNEREISIC